MSKATMQRAASAGTKMITMWNGVRPSEVSSEGKSCERGRGGDEGINSVGREVESAGGCEGRGGKVGGDGGARSAGGCKGGNGEGAGIAMTSTYGSVALITVTPSAVVRAEMLLMACVSATSTALAAVLFFGRMICTSALTLAAVSLMKTSEL